MRKQELHPRTALINKKQKVLSKQARQEALLWLAAFFPRAFDNSVLIQPLKLGIMTDILEHADKAAEAGISKSKLREAVVMYTRRIDYLACLKAKEIRIDLNGNPIAAVTEEEANRAALKIKKRIENSIKNARKTLPSKTSYSTSSKDNYYKGGLDQELDFDQDDHAMSGVNVANMTTNSLRTTSTIVKHKSARAYDPDMVARLKEKLGLARKNDSTKETI